ncbi:MAG: Smr/MutS family protein [Bacteroidia bacterium]|nr:Smr/MutS family protein [Bacteroidia bacterium]
MKFRVGTRVKFLDETGEALVMHIYPNGNIKVLTEEGFEHIMPEGKLIPVPGMEEETEDEAAKSTQQDGIPDFDPEEVISLKEKMFSKRRESAPARDIRTEQIEVDLHIDELVENAKGMSNSEMLAVQISIFRQTMEEALTGRIHKVVFIHGVGAGVLKAEIRIILRADYPACEFFDASMSKYGMGATEVRIR